MRDQQQLTMINIITDTLRRKIETLEQLSKATAEQEELLAGQEPDWDAFEKLMTDKETALERLNVLDDGFMELYERVAGTLRDNGADYADEIQRIQGSIRRITDLSTGLRVAEERNRQRMEIVLSSGRKKVKDFKINSKTAAAYYKNMSGRHQEGDSYFFNRQK